MKVKWYNGYWKYHYSFDIDASTDEELKEKVAEIEAIAKRRKSKQEQADDFERIMGKPCPWREKE